VYQPGTRPGAPLPHAWIDDEDGVRRPIKDLVKPGRFLLMAGENGAPWCQAARDPAGQAGLPLDAVRIGHLDGDLFDPRCTRLRDRQITSEEAVLVRPDRFIGWRHTTMAPDPYAELASALSRILGHQLAPARPVPGSAARPAAHTPGACRLTGPDGRGLPPAAGLSYACAVRDTGRADPR
jgi:2,4-dichlorophenol 6-monooxygenase